MTEAQILIVSDHHEAALLWAHGLNQRSIPTVAAQFDADTLEAHGAVSEEVVLQMAAGAMQRAKADYAIAVSGIAGPDGGSSEKPVGTVWLAWGARDNLHTRCLHWPVERTLFQTMIAAAGLDMIRRTLLGIDTEPLYFKQRGSKN